MERISASSGRARTEYVYDGRGSVIGEVTKSGLLSAAKVTTKAYTPFGEQIGEATSGFGWNGEYYNAVTGQVYLRARFYEPEMNRFSQKDILRGSITEGTSLNRYLFCQNDPINYSDPSGESLKALAKTVGKAVTGAVKTVAVAKETLKTTAKNVVKTAAQTVQTVKTIVKATPVAAAVSVGKSVVSSIKNKETLSQTVSNAKSAATTTLKAGVAATTKALQDGWNEVTKTVSVGAKTVTTYANEQIQQVKEEAKGVDWQKVAKVAMITGSTLEIAAGVVLCATGAGSLLGTALLGAGVSSLVGGGLNELTGGSFAAGWVGGEISGAFTGGGLAAGTALGLGFAGSEALAMLGGFIGGTSGNIITQKIDNGYVDMRDARNDGLINALFAGTAGVFGQIPSIILGAGAGVVGKIIGSGVSLVYEAVFDTFSTYFSSTNGSSVKANIDGSITYASSDYFLGTPKTACAR